MSDPSRRSVLRAAALTVVTGAATVGGPVSALALPTGQGAGAVKVRPGESIQAAVDALPEGGGTVTLAPGRHEITRPVYVRSHLTLEGSGPGRTTIAVPDAYVENFTGLNPGYVGEGMIDLVKGGVTDLVLRGFTLDGGVPADVRNRDGSDGRGGENLKRPWGILLEDRAYPGAQTWSDDNARVEIDDVVVTRTEVGLHVKGCTDLYVHDSHFRENGGVEWFYHNAYLRRDRQVLVERCTFADSHSANGLNLTDQHGIAVRDCRFTGNHFRGLRIAGSTDVTFDSNLCAGSRTDWGLALVAEGTGVTGFTLRNNIVLDNARGLTLSQARNGTLTDNIVFGNAQGDAVAGNPPADVVVKAPEATWEHLAGLPGLMLRLGLVDTAGTARALREQALRHDASAFSGLLKAADGRQIDARGADLLRHELQRVVA